MAEAPLTPDRILDAAEEVLRRFGPQKTTVVDVARALGVSHGALYRHYPSKQALRDAVARRWLHRVSAPLAAIVAGRGAAPVRLRRWMDTLIAVKRAKALEDPDLFAMYVTLAEDARGVVAEHVADLMGQLAAIVAEGAAAGDFRADDPDAAARALYHATARFHHPAHAASWRDPGIDAAFEGVWHLLSAGLAPAGKGRSARS